LSALPREAREAAARSVEALRVIAPYIHKTYLDRSETFSRMAGYEVLLKLENLQKTGSFKARGALYKVFKLRERGVRGVVAASAGNHAQGVAYAASAAGLRSVIVMPETAPVSKVAATRSYGAEVILHGRVFDESLSLALRIAEERGYELVHAFDDIDVIAGNGTIALELLEQAGGFDAVVVPVGGGGLISGIASVLRSRGFKGRIVGVEPEAAPKMLESLRAGRPVRVEPKPSLADGLLAKSPGEITFRIVSELVDDIVTVDEWEIARAMYLLLERAKVLAEGAGAAAVAAIISGKVEARGRVVALVSGGNVDLASIEKVILKGLAADGRLARITGFIPDAPGQLKAVLEVIAAKRCNVVDVLHDRMDPRIPPGQAKVTVIFEAPGRNVIEEILGELEARGYRFEAEH
jgi:threonine dehydratase